MKDLFSVCHEVGRAALATRVPCDVHLDDHIFRFLLDHPGFDLAGAVTYYFDDGQRSAKKLADLLARPPVTRSGPLSLLEFACGYGCVTRHLRAALPQAAITCCDIHPQAVDFIRQRLRCPALLSHHDPDQLVLPQRYDVIFALSFYSHMPRETWGRWIRAHYAALADGGALIFTTHGLKSRTYLSDPIVPDDGFWFSAESEQRDLDTRQYGQTLVTRAFVEQEVLCRTGRPISLYQEAGWWDHQDLYIVLQGEPIGTPS